MSDFEQAKEFAKAPGREWRLETTGPQSTGDFDELVVDHWFHLERMQSHAWWMRVGERRFWIAIDPGSGAVTVSEQEI